MSDTLAPSAAETWKERLGLGDRNASEFFECAAEVADTPHALAIRTAIDELGLSGIFCVQGVPTVAILNMAAYDAARVVDVHGALWNQGLASLLLVAAGDVLRVYVMDGDLPFALTQVTSAIDVHKAPLRSINGASSCQAILGIERFSTLHQRANASIIELRHALLPFSNPQVSGATLPQTEATPI